MTDQQQAQATAECVEIRQHFVSIVSDDGHDICFNCGATAP